MHLNVDNFFSEFLPKPEVFQLESMGGQEVTLQKLSYGASQKISNASIDGIDSDGNPQINFTEANKAKFKKISAALISPKMTPAQLEALSTDADDVIDELYSIIDPKTWQSIQDAKDKAEADGESAD